MTEAFNTSRSATPNAWRTSASSCPSAVGATPTTRALAESVIGLYTTEVIRQNGPWRGLEEIEIATLEWIWCNNHRRLLEPIGYLTPAEYERNFHAEGVEHIHAVLT